MDFDAAVREHADYKVKLVLYLNESGRLDEKRLTAPSSCSLGAWIKQCQKKYDDLDEFHNLVRIHKKFHAEVADILTFIKEEKRYEAKEALSSSGSLSEMTADLSQAILLFRRRLAKLGSSS